MYFNSKKAMAEIVSYVLILLLIVISSIAGYIYLKSAIGDNIKNYDLNNMKSFFDVMSTKIQNIKDFNGQSDSLVIYFNTGYFKILNNSIVYNSQVPMDPSLNYCYKNYCEIADNYYETLVYNLSDGYTFTNNFSLIPGRYKLLFICNKSSKTINVNLIN